MIIRFARAKDKKAVLLLLNQLGEVMNKLVEYSPDNVRVPQLGGRNYTTAIRRRDRRIFVAEEDGDIIAVATFFILIDFMSGKPFGYIDDFVVEKSRRGKGIGTQLLSYIKRWAKDHGMTTIKLSSSTPLLRAHHFYEKNGGVFAQKMIKFALK